jgi:hypothetical protein
VNVETIRLDEWLAADPQRELDCAEWTRRIRQKGSEAVTEPNKRKRATAYSKKHRSNEHHSYVNRKTNQLALSLAVAARALTSQRPDDEDSEDEEDEEWIESKPKKKKRRIVLSDDEQDESAIKDVENEHHEDDEVLCHRSAVVLFSSSLTMMVKGTRRKKRMEAKKRILKQSWKN